MATTRTGQLLTERHRQAQARLAAEFTLRVLRVWPLLDGTDLTAGTSAWLDALIPMIQQGHRVSSALAQRYYQELRILEVGVGLPGSLPTAAFNAEVARAGLAINGPARLERGLRNGQPLERASGVARVESAREATRFVLDGGRRTLMEAIRSDRQSLGYARVTGGSPCAFCSMLASRGPAYTSEATAAFEAHRGCQCSPEPVWSRESAWPPGAQEARSLWDETTQGLGGTDALNAYRRALGRN